MPAPTLGIVRINLESLDFYPGRAIDNDIVLYLKSVFEDSGCDREHDQNVVPANISSTALDSILVTSGLTRSELQLSLIHPSYRPLLNTGDLKVLCLHGRHRIEAAKRFLNSDSLWWTVKIRSLEQISKETLLVGKIRY